MSIEMETVKFIPKINTDDIKLLPQKAFEGKIMLVDTPDKYNIAIAELKNQSVLGFDTETRPSFKKGHKNQVAVLQLSTAEVAYIFRLNKISIDDQLIAIFENPEIVKAGVGIHDDIRSLRRLHEFNPQGFVELQHFVKPYGIEDNSLKKIAAIVLSINISKSQRLSNWETGELTWQQLVYAATDAWVGQQVYEKLSALPLPVVENPIVKE